MIILVKQMIPFWWLSYHHNRNNIFPQHKRYSVCRFIPKMWSSSKLNLSIDINQNIDFSQHFNSEISTKSVDLTNKIVSGLDLFCPKGSITSVTGLILKFRNRKITGVKKKRVYSVKDCLHRSQIKLPYEEKFEKVKWFQKNQICRQ